MSLNSSPLYSPLDNDAAEIRLLSISSAGEDFVSCSLETVSLHKPPLFTAVSYVWGDPSIVETIIVNGYLLEVTTNIANALRHLESHWTSIHPGRSTVDFRLWIDAICINQKNMSEKNFQVPLMGDIYSNAEMVLSWLGLDQPDLVLGVETFNLLSGAINEGVALEEFSWSDWLLQHKALCEDDLGLGLEKDYMFTGSNQSWQATIKLMSLPYWERTWIYQEIVLAKKVYLCMSTQRADLEDLLRVDVAAENFKGMHPWQAILRILAQNRDRQNIQFNHKYADNGSRQFAVGIVLTLHVLGVLSMEDLQELQLNPHDPTFDDAIDQAFFPGIVPSHGLILHWRQNFLNDLGLLAAGEPPDRLIHVFFQYWASRK